MPAGYAIIFMGELQGLDLGGKQRHMKSHAPIYQDFNSIPTSAIDRCYYHNCSIENHYHMNPELVYVSAGNLDVTINSETETIAAGQFCLVLPWQFHAYDTPDNSEAMIIVFPSRYIQVFIQKMSAYCGTTQVFDANPSIKALFMEYLYDDAAEPNEYMFMSIMYGLCHSFMEHCSLKNTDIPTESSLQIQMMNYISSHQKGDLSLKTFAQQFGYSYYYLSRLFRKNTRLGFHQFCNIKRVESAVALLETEELTISEISWQCGFRNLRTFNRVFLQLIGQSPSQYRNECLEHNSSMVRHESYLRLSTHYRNTGA